MFLIIGKLSALRWPDFSQADSVSLWVNLCPSSDDRGIALAKGSSQGSILWVLIWSHRVSLSQISFPMKPAPCSGFLSSFPSGIYGITFSTTSINVFFKGFFASLVSQYFKVYTIWAGEIPQLEKCLPCKYEPICLMPRGGDRTNIGTHKSSQPSWARNPWSQ